MKTEEVDWSNLPVEVWASGGEEFIPLHSKHTIFILSGPTTNSTVYEFINT